MPFEAVHSALFGFFHESLAGRDETCSDMTGLNIREERQKN
jgi:hypothetical protein